VFSVQFSGRSKRWGFDGGVRAELIDAADKALRRGVEFARGGSAAGWFVEESDAFFLDGDRDDGFEAGRDGDEEGFVGWYVDGAHGNGDWGFGD